MFGCDHGADVRPLQAPDTAVVSLLCAGQLPPSFVEYALRSGAQGVLVAGCRECDCAFRLGTWLTPSACAASASRICGGPSLPPSGAMVWAGRRPRARASGSSTQFRSSAQGRVRAGMGSRRTRRLRMPKRTRNRRTSCAVRRCSPAFIGCLLLHPRYRHLAHDQALLKLSFTHAGQLVHECRRRTPEELAKLPPNMRAPLDCPRERSPVTVELALDGQLLAQREIAALRPVAGRRLHALRALCGACGQPSAFGQVQRQRA